VPSFWALDNNKAAAAPCATRARVPDAASAHALGGGDSIALFLLLREGPGGEGGGNMLRGNRGFEGGGAWAGTSSLLLFFVFFFAPHTLVVVPASVALIVQCLAAFSASTIHFITNTTVPGAGSVPRHQSREITKRLEHRA